MPWGPLILPVLSNRIALPKEWQSDNGGGNLGTFLAPVYHPTTLWLSIEAFQETQGGQSQRGEAEKLPFVGEFHPHSLRYKSTCSLLKERKKIPLCRLCERFLPFHRNLCYFCSEPTKLPLAAALFCDDEEGLLCVRKTPGAMGWEPRVTWATPNVLAPAVYSWSARLLLWDSSLGSGELLSCGSLFALLGDNFFLAFFFFLPFCSSFQQRI